MEKIKLLMNTKDNAVAGVLVAVMIVGLVIAVIAIIQTIYIPDWMEAREADHMGVVAEQFSQLKYAIDIQAATKQPSPISTSITLGSRELGLLMSSKAYGSLETCKDGWTLQVKAQGVTNQTSCSIITYSSQNSYYLDQTYTYEVGAVILGQSQGNILMIPPSFSVSYDSDTPGRIVYLNFKCIDLRSIGGKTSLNGYETYPIRTEYLTSVHSHVDSVSSILINTSYPVVWYQFLDHILSNAGIPSEDYTLTQVGNTVTIAIDNIAIRVLNLNMVTISTQLSPGWVE